MSSRFDGAVYRVDDDGSHEQVASELGVACGLAFDDDGWMYVGDRSGTIFRVRDGAATPFATLPPSVAAFHLAMSPSSELFVTAPTLAPTTTSTASIGSGEVRTLPHALGPAAGAGVRARRHAARRSTRWPARAASTGFAISTAEPELVVSGDALVGVAFGPQGELVVASTTPPTGSTSRDGRRIDALFARKPIADARQPPDDDAHSLKRVLGAGDLVMLAIGAVIGAGIFGAIGTAAAGQVGPDGEVIRYGAGPALVFSFVLLGAACALAALCYAELAAMIPQAGSAYAYSYATLGELVAWIIGWDLILEYAVGNVAVAISWGDYFTTLLRGVGVDLPAWLTTGYRTALLSSNPDVQRSARHGAARGRHPDPRQPAGVRHRDAHHLAAAARRARELHGQQRDGGDQAAGAGAVHRRRADEHRPGELHAVCAERLHRHPPGRGDRVLCLHRLRRDLDRGRGDAATRSATCRSAFSAGWRSAR